MRDDFPISVVEALAKRVASRCSNPRCRKPTHGPQQDPTKVINIGVAAHITAAAGGGPRFDASITSEVRRSVENGIWLCQNCAKLVDNDPNMFTVETLRDWKRQSEVEALFAVTGKGFIELGEISRIEVNLFKKDILISKNLHLYQLQAQVINLGKRLIDQYHFDLSFPRIVLNNPEKLCQFVGDRSSKEFAFFRRAVTSGVEPIFPGDTLTVMTLDYQMDENLFERRGRLFDVLVTASLYCGDGESIVTEVPFGQLQSY